MFFNFDFVGFCVVLYEWSYKGVSKRGQGYDAFDFDKSNRHRLKSPRDRTLEPNSPVDPEHST